MKISLRVEELKALTTSKGEELAVIAGGLCGLIIFDCETMQMLNVLNYEPP